MKLIDIQIPADTITIEKERPPEKMSYDDFFWCINVVFSFLGTSLVIEAPFLGFVRKLLHAMHETTTTGSPVQLNDEYGAYQLTIVRNATHIIISDAFSGSCAQLPVAAFTQEIRQEINRTSAELEGTLPSLLNNESYCVLKKEVNKTLVMGDF